MPKLLQEYPELLDLVYKIQDRVYEIRSEEPMDGDAVDDLCDEIREVLNEINGNQ